MKKYGYFLFLIICIISCRSIKNEQKSESGDLVEPEIKYGIPVSEYDIQTGVIKAGDYFGALLLKAGVSNNKIQEVISAGQGVFDITKIKTGNEYEFLYKKDTSSAVLVPAYFIYECDATSHVLCGLQDSVFVKVIEKEIKVEKKYVEVTIHASLWEDVVKAGVPPLLALKLSEDIYAWTIDFFGLQKGDSFQVIYDELICDGEFVGIRNIYYSEFYHNSALYRSIRFEEAEKGNLYWNEKGESLRKAFLKAPLSFTRISSRFTYARKHPIYKTVRPHTGVDYAAPSGTPVMTIGDGVVVSKGWAGGGGNTVKIKHNSIYTTSYMHLKAYAKGLKRGDRVRQGDVIGYVGSTGASTGPHLDFRVWKNGSPVDPLKMESPPANPVHKENRAAFEATYEQYRHEMDSLAALKYVDQLIRIL